MNASKRCFTGIAHAMSKIEQLSWKEIRGRARSAAGSHSSLNKHTQLVRWVRSQNEVTGNGRTHGRIPRKSFITRNGSG
ncbi:hypothetical protein M407DRAFT_196641 [Tulasnella calospora MUT 4182]|uniref:Uncharacterized protein n=1 Tax=Tulasnella calospora MUT 4182 TaxID=1051891 RepID=A0A0C3QIS4_9AGAM|nr:hypothetical protein M407DRAFT_196641 [Tulasnella calospora MUT 4182]